MSRIGNVAGWLAVAASFGALIFIGASAVGDADTPVRPLGERYLVHVCDGSTAIYTDTRRAIDRPAVVPNSDECPAEVTR